MTTLIKSAVLAFSPSDSPDVEGYNLYMVGSGVALTREPDGTVPGAQMFDLGKPDSHQDGKVRVDLAMLPNMTTNDGVYNLGVAAYDKAGNESSFLIIADVPLDFVAPNAPMDGVIERP